MPSRLVALGVFCALLFVTSHAAAQDGSIPDPVFAAPAHGAPCQEHLVAVQMMLGLEDFARLQVEVLHRDRWTLMVEAQAGVEAIFLPSLGAGLRVGYRAFDDGQSNAFLISPGVDLLYATAVHGDLISHPGLALVSASVDFSWVHDFAPHFATELGVQLGAIVPMTSSGWIVIPELSVFAGLRF